MPFVKCPECGKLNSVKLKNCPKCEASLDTACASYNTDTQIRPAGIPTGASATGTTAWGQPVQQQTQQPQNNPWGQPVQQNAPITQHCTTCGNQVVAGARFCAGCGSPVSATQQPAGIPTRKNPYFI